MSIVFYYLLLMLGFEIGWLAVMLCFVSNYAINWYIVIFLIGFDLVYWFRFLVMCIAIMGGVGYFNCDYATLFVIVLGLSCVLRLLPGLLFVCWFV